MKDTPTTAYLIMAYNPQYWYRGLINVAEQDWPNENKVVYLLHQPEPDGTRVPELQHDMPFTVKQFWLDGTWPALWFFKYDRFFKECAEKYYCVFDEDDWYETNYTQAAMAPLLKDEDAADIAWNNTNIHIKRGYMKRGHYPSAIGTVCARVDQMEAAFNYLRVKYPDGVFSPRGGAGALDHIYRKIIMEMFIHPQIQQHCGLRFYFHHRGAQTQGGRPHTDKIDYLWDGYPYDKLRHMKPASEMAHMEKVKHDEGTYQKMYHRNVQKNLQLIGQLQQKDREIERLTDKLDRATGRRK